MGDRDDANGVLITPEDKSVREPSQWKPPMDRVQLFAKGRKLDKHGANPLDLKEEIVTQSLELSFIVFLLLSVPVRQQERARLSLLEARTHAFKHFISRDGFHKARVELRTSALHFFKPRSIRFRINRTVQFLW